MEQTIVNTPLQCFIKHCSNNFHQNQNDNGEILAAIAYLHEERSVTDRTITQHHIGYCHQRESVPDAIKGYGEDVKDRQWDLSRFFQGRIIVPIYDEVGDAVGIATRVPSPDFGNVWWNLPNPFRKGQHLFLLNKSRRDIFEQNKAYIVEGYMDALILFQQGLTNVVAIMGTAMSLRQVGLLARYCDRICLCFDTDENNSGDKGKQKTISTLHQLQCCKFLTVIDSLPMRQDPASYVQKHDIQQFTDLERIVSDQEIREICRNVS